MLRLCFGYLSVICGLCFDYPLVVFLLYFGYPLVVLCLFLVFYTETLFCLFFAVFRAFWVISRLCFGYLGLCWIMWSYLVVMSVLRINDYGNITISF